MKEEANEGEIAAELQGTAAAAPTRELTPANKEGFFFFEFLRTPEEFHWIPGFPAQAGSLLAGILWGRQQQQPLFCCVITPSFVLTALPSQGHGKAIKTDVCSHRRRQTLRPKLLLGPTSQQSAGESRNSAGNDRPCGVYPLLCDLQVPIHYGCGGLLFRWTCAARCIIKTYGDKQRRKHLIDPK